MAEIILKNLKVAVYYLVYTFKQGKKNVDMQNVEWRQPTCGMQQDCVNACVWLQRVTLG